MSNSVIPMMGGGFFTIVPKKYTYISSSKHMVSFGFIYCHRLTRLVITGYGLVTERVLGQYKERY